ncbi:hypothetical protein LSH36_89g07067 [Paralvinella palmiformis]|uniref:Uncharacterized protein n=1 Tax=Paralvinella palmiformis TaxID=53620 RepID=A0AAD9K1T0_9ANNE|nr:hypothetical protein LSH36_89g07067 [Paralvinella palmiformis]
MDCGTWPSGPLAGHRFLWLFLVWALVNAWLPHDTLICWINHPLIRREYMRSVCKTNVHKRCAKNVANNCGINTKTMAEVLDKMGISGDKLNTSKKKKVQCYSIQILGNCKQYLEEKFKSESSVHQTCINHEIISPAYVEAIQLNPVSVRVYVTESMECDTQCLLECMPQTPWSVILSVCWSCMLECMPQCPWTVNVILSICWSACHRLHGVYATESMECDTQCLLECMPQSPWSVILSICWSVATESMECDT